MRRVTVRSEISVGSINGGITENAVEVGMEELTFSCGISETDKTELCVGKFSWEETMYNSLFREVKMGRSTHSPQW